MPGAELEFENTLTLRFTYSNSLNQIHLLRFIYPVT